MTNITDATRRVTTSDFLQVTKNIKNQLHIYHLKTLKTLKRERNVS